MPDKVWRILLLFLYLTSWLVTAQLTATDILHDDHTGPSGAPAARHTLRLPDVEAEDRTNAEEFVRLAVANLHQLRASHTLPQKSQGLLGTLLHYSKSFLPRISFSGPSSNIRDGFPTATAGDSSLLAETARLLEEAAGKNNSDALFLLAEMNFYGNFTLPRNYSQAFKYYEKLAVMDGNSSAQHMLGFMYATGIGGAVERDQAKALLYHTFAAQAGHTRSEMTVAFRHHSAIGTSRNCDEGAHYYKKVADKAIKYYRSGPPGGRAWVSDSYRLADDEGGVYGEGASVSSAGVHAQKGGPGSDAHAALDDVLEYLELMSGKGDFKATFSLGRINYDGQKDLPRDLKSAKRYFQIVASQYWKRNGDIANTEDKPSLEDIACKAAGYLGRMFLRAEGVKQDFSKAMKWFSRGVKGGDAGAQHGMGIMYHYGLGVPQNTQKAFDYYKAAADQNYAPAQVQVGAMYLDQGSTTDLHIAYKYFELAARFGGIESYYYLAEMINQGVTRERSCGLATAYYKSVAEKAEPLLSSFAEANAAIRSGDKELALIGYMMAAEQGYEKAQANVAYLLDQETSVLSLRKYLPAVVDMLHEPRSSLLQNAALALIYWTRSAKQANIDSMVKMGDYYLNGIGVQKDMEKAASCYTAASEHQQSAQALYNLGWMHENGVGLTQDYHLAKRYYDYALETNEEAYLPVSLSLLKLRLKSAWNTLTHGKINSIHDEPIETKQWSAREWISNFLRDGQKYADDYEDDIVQHDDLMPGGDDDGYYDDALDDGIIETIIIMALAASLVWLIYYRQARQLAHRRAVEAEARRNGQPLPEAPDRGLFPAPGDPAFPDWAVGGVGH